MGALERWRDALASWAIPDEILERAPESPWGSRPEIFTDRARHASEPSAAAFRETGIRPRREDEEVRREAGGFPDREAAVAQARRMLCLTPDRDAEVAEALGPRLRRGPTGWRIRPAGRRVVRLWWDP